MAIPDEISDRLDSNPAWAIQHEDIVRVMDEQRKEKPWSRYMIQQNLDGDPAKKTVTDRLDELVELDVLVDYEYRNLTLYDLAYDPIVTDGGSLTRTHPKDLILLRDRSASESLSMGALYTSIIFLFVGVIELNFIGTAGESIFSPSSESLLIGTALMVFVFGFFIAILSTALDRYETHIKPKIWGD